MLLADLPALRPEDLQVALEAARTALDDGRLPMAAVPDADGTGTVLLAARTPARLDPAFGPGSFAEHLRRGAVPLRWTCPGCAETSTPLATSMPPSPSAWARGPHRPSPSAPPDAAAPGS